MPNYLHRTEDVYLTSYSPTALPEPIGNYIEDPDLSAVAGFEIRYWIITGDIVTLMDQTARDAVDAQIANDALLDNRADAVTRASLDIGTRELVDVLLFEINKINTRLQEVYDTFNDMKGTATLAALRNQIPDPALGGSPAPAEFSRIQPKIRSQILQDYVDGINAGDSDP